MMNDFYGKVMVSLLFSQSPFLHCICFELSILCFFLFHFQLVKCCILVYQVVYWIAQMVLLHSGKNAKNGSVPLICVNNLS